MKVRFNLSIPAHQEAYDILKNADASMTSYVVEAINEFSQIREDAERDLERQLAFRRILREELTHIRKEETAQQEEVQPVSTEAARKADDFLKTFV